MEGIRSHYATYVLDTSALYARRDLKCITPRLRYASLVANARRDLKCITPRLRYASLVANARRNKYDFTCAIIAHDGQIGPDVEPVPPAGPGCAGQPLSAISSAAQRGSCALGSLSACLGGDPLRRCGDRFPALLGQSHPHPREIGSDGA